MGRGKQGGGTKYHKGCTSWQTLASRERGRNDHTRRALFQLHQSAWVPAPQREMPVRARSRVCSRCRTWWTYSAAGLGSACFAPESAFAQKERDFFPPAHLRSHFLLCRLPLPDLEAGAHPTQPVCWKPPPSAMEEGCGSHLA